jgi:hypothetical protein
VQRIDWDAARLQIRERGFAVVGPVLTASECAELIGIYDRDELFRSRVIMARHGFGQGEYRYFDYPLPNTVQRLREEFYPELAPIANEWAEALKTGISYPARLEDMLARCHEAGQLRPTPLLLKYQPGDYNCLHQDLYGPQVFPLQATVLLNAEFTGGDFVLVEQRPRMQSRAEVVPLQPGQPVIFAVHHRPKAGTRGAYRVNMRHGVGTVRTGNRRTLGLIFHDAA